MSANYLIKYDADNTFGSSAAGLASLQAAGGLLDLIFGNTQGLGLRRGASAWGPDNVRYVDIPLVGVTSTSGGGLGTWQPAEGVPVVIIRALLYVKTGSTGAASVEVGQGSSPTTGYTNLITSQSVHTAAVVWDSITQQIIAATAGESGIASLAQYLPTANQVTITGSADTTGFVGNLLLSYYVPGQTG